MGLRVAVPTGPRCCARRLGGGRRARCLPWPSRGSRCARAGACVLNYMHPVQYVPLVAPADISIEIWCLSLAFRSHALIPLAMPYGVGLVVAVLGCCRGGVGCDWRTVVGIAMTMPSVQHCRCCGTVEQPVHHPRARMYALCARCPCTQCYHDSHAVAWRHACVAPGCFVGKANHGPWALLDGSFRCKFSLYNIPFSTGWLPNVVQSARIRQR